MVDLRLGNCLELMQEIDDKSIDLILCDLPYGVLNKNNEGAKWDNTLPLDRLWEQYERIIKDNGAIILFASGMFTADLMYSNKKLWKYNLIWKKGNRVSGFLNAKKQPLRNHEDICVFYRNQPTYNPQMTIGNVNHSVGKFNKGVNNNCYGNLNLVQGQQDNLKYPISILDFDKEHPQKYHPTQKPIDLLVYLIQTYTNINDLVLDNCMGSGSTGVACKMLQRDFIGIEADEKYFEMAKDRIALGYSNILSKNKNKVQNKKKNLF